MGKLFERYDCCGKVHSSVISAMICSDLFLVSIKYPEN